MSVKLSCYLNNVHCNALWDTGAQVSVVSEDFVRNNLPNMEVRPPEELIDTLLDLKPANGTSFLLVGWVEIDFKFCDLNNSSGVVTPILVGNSSQQFLLSSLIPVSTI